MRKFVAPDLIDCSTYEVSFAMGCPSSTTSSCGIAYRRT